MEKTISTYTYGTLKSHNGVYTLTNPRTTIGRNKACIINIQHPSISKDQAVIELKENKYITITDLNSSNGTYVNGQRLQNESKQLKTNDIISFGLDNIEYIFESLIKENNTNVNIYTSSSPSNHIHDGKISLVNENEYEQTKVNHLKHKKQMFIPSCNEMLIEDNNNNNNSCQFNKEKETKQTNKQNEMNSKGFQYKKEENIKLNDLFNQLTEEYKKLNSKHNALMIYASDLQKKVDLQDLELSELRNSKSHNQNFTKIINDKDNIITLLQNELNYYKEQLQLFQYNYSKQSNINTNYNSIQINKKLDTLLTKYMKDSSKSENNSQYYTEQLTKQLSIFNHTINEYKERVGDILKQVPLFFKKNQKEEAAKYLVEQIDYFMNENKHLRNENAKLMNEITLLKGNNLNNDNNNKHTEQIEKTNVDKENEIEKMKDRIDELEKILMFSSNEKTGRYQHVGNWSSNSNEFMMMSPYLNSERLGGSDVNKRDSWKEGEDVKECLFNAINELNEKEKTINDLKAKLKEKINSKENVNYLDDEQIQQSMIQTLKYKDDVIKSLQTRYNASLNYENKND